MTWIGVIRVLKLGRLTRAEHIIRAVIVGGKEPSQKVIGKCIAFVINRGKELFKVTENSLETCKAHGFTIFRKS